MNSLLALVTVTAFWQNATLNTDSTPIPSSGPGSLTQTTVEYGTCTSRNPDVFGTKQGEVSVTAPAQQLELNLVVVQEYCLRATHTNTYAAVSAYSNVAFKSTIPQPNPPVNLTTTSPIVYNVLKIEDGFATIPIGTVPLGTPCDMTNSVNGMGVVPVELVDWTNDRPDAVRSVVVVAQCG